MNPNADPRLVLALKQAVLRNQQWKRLHDDEPREDGLIVPRATPSPEHYHVVFNIPKDDLSIPNFREIHISAQEGYQKIFDYAMAAQPNVEFYDEGIVGLEMRMPGRTDLWWVVLELAACVKASCLNLVSREKLKRTLVLLPEVDPTEGARE